MEASVSSCRSSAFFWQGSVRGEKWLGKGFTRCLGVQKAKRKRRVGAGGLSRWIWAGQMSSPFIVPPPQHEINPGDARPARCQMHSGMVGFFAGFYFHICHSKTRKEEARFFLSMDKKEGDRHSQQPPMYGDTVLRGTHPISSHLIH